MFQSRKLAPHPAPNAGASTEHLLRHTSCSSSKTWALAIPGCSELCFHGLWRAWENDVSVLCLFLHLQNGGNESKVPLSGEDCCEDQPRLYIKTCSIELGFITLYYADVIYYGSHLPGTFRSYLEPIPHRSRMAVMKERSLFSKTNCPR